MAQRPLVRLAAALLALAAPVPAGSAERVDLASLDRAFKERGIEEPLLHTHEMPPPMELAVLAGEKDFKRVLPRCAPGKAELPDLYSKDYEVRADAAEKLRGMLRSARRYADARAALADGYLPTEEYETGLGVGFANAKLVADGKADWSRPDILLYVKRQGAQAYALVGLVFLAGEGEPPDAFQVARPGANRVVRQWRPWEGVCLRSAGGLIAYSDPEDAVEAAAGAVCEGGAFYRRIWMMHVWLPLYNPRGLFTPRNPLVDHLDITQKAIPFCG